MPKVFWKKHNFAPPLIFRKIPEFYFLFYSSHNLPHICLQFVTSQTFFNISVKLSTEVVTSANIKTTDVGFKRNITKPEFAWIVPVS